MINFDHEKYDVVGIAQKTALNNNAHISIIGISDRETGRFTRIDHAERQKLFPSRGFVFAFDFFKKFPDWQDECVCIAVKPNNNQNVVNGEAYVWSWQYDEFIFATKAINLSSKLTENGNENYEILSKHGLLNSEDIEYAVCGNRIYEIKNDTRLIPYWNIDDVIGAFVLKFGDSYYVFDDIAINDAGKVDITNDDQLIEWYKKNILKKEWETIYEAKEFSVVNNRIKELLNRVNLPTNIFESRLSRITSMTKNIDLTFAEIEDLATSAWFEDIVNASIEAYANDYLEKVKEIKREELELVVSDQKEKIRMAIGELMSRKEILDRDIKEKEKTLEDLDTLINAEMEKKSRELQENNERLESLKQEVRSKEEELAKIGSKKDEIIDSFSVIRDVLGSNKRHEEEQANPFMFEDVDNAAEEYPIIQAFKKNLEIYLKKFKANNVSIDEIVQKLATHKTVLLPDDATLKALLHATGRCTYLTSFVDVTWKSYQSLWAGGLGAILEECKKYPSTIHYLILRNINMSYIPCYLQPIFDIESDFCSFIPNSTDGFPDNLKILCTCSEDEIIPMSKGVLKKMGCIGHGTELTAKQKMERASIKHPIIDGYLSEQLLNSIDKGVEEQFEDSYEEYIK